MTIVFFYLVLFVRIDWQPNIVVTCTIYSNDSANDDCGALNLFIDRRLKEERIESYLTCLVTWQPMYCRIFLENS